MPVLIDFILKAISIGFSAGVPPGPLQAVFLSLAMKGGWKKALPAAFAPIVSDGPVMLLVLLVLNNLPDQFLVTLQIAGAIFLLYLAWDAFKAFRNYQAIEEIQTISGWGTLLKATLMNILGPGPWLFWSLINGPNLLQAWEIAPWWGILYISSFYGVFILTNIALIVLFSSMRKMGEKVRRVLLLLSAILLVGFAVYSFLQGIQLI